MEKRNEGSLEGEKKGGNFYYFSLITKLQRSLTTLEITMNSTSADKQGRTGPSSSQFILSGFDVVRRYTLMMCPLTRMILRSLVSSIAATETSKKIGRAS